MYLYLSDTVTSIPRDGLHGCSALTYLNIPPACTEIGAYGLNGCSNLVTLDMTRATSLKSTSSEKGLNGLSSVKELIFPEGFESFGGMSSAASLTYVYFPNTTKHIGSIQNAKFTEFVIPDGITSLGNKAFDYCPSLQKVTIPKTVTSIVIGNNPTFFGTTLTNLKEIIYTGSENDPIVEQLKIAVPKATIIFKNHCDVYYGEHITEEIKYEFTSFIDNSYDTSICTRCNEKVILEAYQPIMTFTGYSAKINGNKVSVTYKIDRDLMKLYEEKAGKAEGTVKIGVTASVAPEGATQYETITDELKPINDKTIVVEVSSEYKFFDFILSGFSSTSYEKLLVMCAYVYDGSEIYYIDKGGCNTYATPFTFSNEAK